jgi:mono/diheme cytochrome c family protein
MRSRLTLVVAIVAWIGVGAAAASRPPAAGHGPDNQVKDTWKIPAGADAEKSPLTLSPAVIAAGQKLFVGKCQRCHGKQAKGNGPDAEPEHEKDMDLTVAARADKNPDGVVFYRIWNGRTSPKMPAFSKELSKEQAWALVAYVQTLRAK